MSAARWRVVTTLCDCCKPQVQVFAAEDHATIYFETMREHGHPARVEKFCLDCEVWHDADELPGECDRCGVCFGSPHDGELCDECQERVNDEECCGRCVRCTGVSPTREL